MVNIKNWDNWTEKQRVVYDLYYNQKLTQKVIFYRLKISQQAVSKLIKKINKNSVVREKITGGCISKGMVTQRGLYKIWRIEAMSFNVKPYYFYPRYAKKMKEIGNYSIPHKNWRIFLHEKIVRIQLKEGVSFRHLEKDAALKAAEDDFNIFLYFASNKYGFEYEKEGRISISCNNMEIEQEGSEFAKGYIKESGETMLNIRDNNGKICFFIDRSKSDEHGYKGKDAYSHSEVLEPYIKDFLYYNPLNNSQITMRINDIVNALEKMTKVIEEMKHE